MPQSVTEIAVVGGADVPAEFYGGQAGLFRNFPHGGDLDGFPGFLMPLREVPQAAPAYQQTVAAAVADKPSGGIHFLELAAYPAIDVAGRRGCQEYPLGGGACLEHIHRQAHIPVVTGEEFHGIRVGKGLVRWLADDYAAMSEIYPSHGCKVRSCFPKQYICNGIISKELLSMLTPSDFSRLLLDTGAVLLRPEEPFTWASGWHSPIYCDNRRLLSFPDIRAEVAGTLAAKAGAKYSDADVVAGVATGAIAWGLMVAERMGKPFAYVRPKPKDHGTGSQIEGILPEGAKVLVVEDLVSTGMSSLAAVDALRTAGAEVLGMLAVFTYGFPLAEERFAASGVRLDTVSDYGSLVSVAEDEGKITAEQAGVLAAWRKNPSEWGR